MRILLKITLITLLTIFIPYGVLYALPQIDNIENPDDVSISNPDPNTMEITASDNTIINYSSFDIQENESFIVILPSQDSQILNRVTGIDATDISGNLTCNGIFFLVNPNGINVLPTANITTHGLVLSTRDISSANFINHNYIFNKIKDGNDYLLLNKGNITLTHAGFGVFIAGGIKNEGTITAYAGSIVLAAGKAIELRLSQDNSISVAILEEQAQDVLDHEGNPILDQIHSTGTLSSNRGVVTLKADSIPGIFRKSINLEGYVSAKSIDDVEGTVNLIADNDIQVTGTIEATNLVIGKPEELIPDNILITDTSDIVIGKDTTIISNDSIQIDAPITSPNIYLESGALRLNSIISDNIFLYKTLGDIIIDNTVRSDSLITIEGEGINITYLIACNVTLKSNNMIDTQNAAIIPATTITLIANKFGDSKMSPLNIDSLNIHLIKLQGDINILESTGIGTSILINGPPTDNLLGFILYPNTSNLTLEADHVILTGDNPIHLYGNITFHNFICTTPGKYIYFEAGKTYTFKGYTHIVIDHKDYPVWLLSSQAGTQWYIDIELGTYELTRVAVGDSYNITQDAIYATPSSNRGNNTNWNLNTPSWRGTSGGTWSTATNWDPQVIPTSTDAVVFDGVDVDDSVVDLAWCTAEGEIASLDIQSGYSGVITLHSDLTDEYYLTISGNLTVSDGVLAIGDEVLEVKGNSNVTGGTVTLNGSGNNEWLTVDLTIGAGGTVTCLGSEDEINVSGDWDSSDATATWTPKYSNVSFSGGGSAIDITVAVDGEGEPTQTFYGVTIIANTTGAKTLKSNIEITDDFAFILGKLDMSTFDISVGGNCVVYNPGFGDIENFLLSDGSNSIDITGYMYVGSVASGDTLIFDISGFNGTINAGGLILAGTDSGLSGNVIVICGANSDFILSADPTAVSIESATSGNNELRASSNTFNVDGDWDNNDTFTKGTSTVIFDSATTQTLDAGSGSFNNITVSGSTLQLTGNTLDVDGILTVNDSKIFDLNGQNLTATGATLVNNGTVKLQGGETITDLTNDVDSGTWLYIGKAAGDTTIKNFDVGAGNVDYFNLTINGAGKNFILGNALNVDGNLTITNGTLDVVNGSDYAINVAGDWANAGTFTARAGTVTFDGASAQTITSGGSSFYDVTFSNTTDIEDDPNINYTGALTIGGATTLTQNTSIASTNNTAIEFSSTINGNKQLKLNSGTNTITVTGAVGNTEHLDWFVIVNSGGATFSSTVNVDTMVITDTADDVDITFDGAVDFDILNILSEPDNKQYYNLSFLKGGTIDAFGNGTRTYGNITINSAITDVFDIGVNNGLGLATQENIYLIGNISCDLGMSFGEDTTSLTLNGDTTLESSNGTITFTSRVSGSGKTLTLSVVGDGTISFSTGIDVNTLTVKDTTGVLFQGGAEGAVNIGTFTIEGDVDGSIQMASVSTVIGTLDTSGGGSYSIAFEGSSFQIAALTGTTFSNEEGVTLGNDEYSNIYFGSAVNTGVNAVTSGGTVRTNGKVITIGALTLAYDTVFDTSDGGGVAIGAGIEIDTIDGSGYDLDFTAGTGNVTITGNIGATAKIKDLNFNSATTADMQGTVNISGNVTIGAGITLNTNDNNWDIDGNWTNNGTYNAGSQTLTIGGNFTQNGTWNYGTSKVIFDDNSKTSTITGTTFYDFTCTTPGKTLEVTVGNTETILNALTLTGADGNLITLQSTAEGSTFYIDPQGSIDVSYTQVQDSNNINGGYIFPYGADRQGSVDLGNTSMWFEGSNPPPPPVDPSVDPHPWWDEVRKKRKFKKGKYYVVVIVYDGKVVVTPYDDQGIKYDQEVVLTAGESFSSRDGIKKIQKNIEQP